METCQIIRVVAWDGGRLGPRSLPVVLVGDGDWDVIDYWPVPESACVVGDSTQSCGSGSGAQIDWMANIRVQCVVVWWVVATGPDQPIVCSGVWLKQDG